jgi:antirestriction protein
MLNIYINTWGNYNENGADLGEWITLPMDADELEETLERVADAMNDDDPEWFINDYEWTCETHIRDIDENEDISELNELMQRLDGLDGSEQKAFFAYMDAISIDIEDALDCIENGAYVLYEGSDLEDVAYDLVNDCYFTKDTPDIFTRYFDYAAFARDLSYDGYHETPWGVLYVE